MADNVKPQDTDANQYLQHSPKGTERSPCGIGTQKCWTGFNVNARLLCCPRYARSRQGLSLDSSSKVSATINVQKAHLETSLIGENVELAQQQAEIPSGCTTLA